MLLSFWVNSVGEGINYLLVELCLINYNSTWGKPPWFYLKLRFYSAFNSKTAWYDFHTSYQKNRLLWTASTNRKWNPPVSGTWINRSQGLLNYSPIFLKIGERRRTKLESVDWDEDFDFDLIVGKERHGTVTVADESGLP